MDRAPLTEFFNLWSLSQSCLLALLGSAQSLTAKKFWFWKVIISVFWEKFWHRSTEGGKKICARNRTIIPRNCLCTQVIFTLPRRNQIGWSAGQSRSSSCIDSIRQMPFPMLGASGTALLGVVPPIRLLEQPPLSPTGPQHLLSAFSCSFTGNQDQNQLVLIRNCTFLLRKALFCYTVSPLYLFAPFCSIAINTHRLMFVQMHFYCFNRTKE